MERDHRSRIRLGGFAIAMGRKIGEQKSLVQKKRKAMEKALQVYQLEVARLDEYRKLEEGSLLAYAQRDQEFESILAELFG